MFTEKAKKLLGIFSAPLALFSTLLVFGVSSIYFTNAAEYDFYYGDIIWTLLEKTLGYALLLSIVLFLIPKKYSLRDRAINLVTMVAALFWVQGAFLASQLTVLDGSETSVDLTSGPALISTALWILGLAVATFLPKLSRYALHFSAIVIISQLVVLGAEVEYVKSPASIEDEWAKNYTINWDNDDMFSFSDKENVIFIIVDSFDQLTFEKMMEQDESAKKLFAGFTSYRNLTASFFSTWGNVSSIVAGQAYNNSIPFFQFVRETQTSDTSLPAFFKKNGFINRLYLALPPAPYYFDNILYSNVSLKKEAAANDIINVACYRNMPHFVKAFFLSAALSKKQNNRYWDMKFVDSMKSKTFDSTSSSPVFFLAHWLGLHEPYWVDENFVNHFENISHFRQGKAIFKMLGIFFENLKNVEAFDNSTIVVMADHSLYQWAQNNNNRSYPFFLVKPKGSGQAELRYDDTPLTNTDVAQILLHIRSTGDTNVKQFAAAERYHFIANGNRLNTSPSEQYMPPLYEYKLTKEKRPYESNAWQPTGTVYTSTPVLTERVYNFPEDYEKVGNIFSQWQAADAGITFGDAPQTVIFNLKNEKRFSKLTIEFAPSENLGDYNLIVNSRNQYRGKLSETQATVEEIVTLSDYDLNTVFKKPITIQKLSIASSDAIGELFALKHNVHYGNQYLPWVTFFSQARNTRPDLPWLSAISWNIPEESNGLWSAAEVAPVILPLAFTPDKDLSIILGGFKFLPPNQENYVRIKSGDQTLFERRLDESNANKPIEFIFPLSNVDGNTATFTIETNTFNTNKDLGWNSGDTRTLGYFLQSITLIDPPTGSEE
jgi:hypothetical protein